MVKKKSHGNMIAPIGSTEPHAPLLNVPNVDQSLFKMMTAENLLRSIDDAYLHFNRVDSYIDFTGADPYDGQQLPKDQKSSAQMRFEKAPDFSAADYYNQSRARTYACCFSIENSDFIWNNYANNSSIGKVCIVFKFGKLRECLNSTLQSGNASLIYNGNRCRQIFSLNYGIVEYVEWHLHKAYTEHLPNPIQYVYLKDKKFSDEKELRISLSAVGTGQFMLNDGSTLQFPESLQLVFDFREAIANGTIQQILYPPDCDSNSLKAKLSKLHIVSS
jgi:hypothetical protein